MKVGYVLLYVDDAGACRGFCVAQIGMGRSFAVKQ